MFVKASLQEQLREAEKKDDENVKRTDALRNQILEMETKYAENIKEMKEKNDKLKVIEQTLSDTYKNIEVLRTSINNKVGIITCILLTFILFIY